MPWKQVNPMDERVRFVVETQLGMKSIQQLCHDYGISRKTGYKWLERHAEGGFEACMDQSRAPHSCPHKTSDKIEARLIELRNLYPKWGPKKLVALLEMEMKESHVISASTAGDILYRHGLVVPRKVKKRNYGKTKTHFLREPTSANDVWAVDYKGWFRTKDHFVCHPLTVTDLHSRYVLWCKGHRKQSASEVEKDFETIFTTYGVPLALRMDNGSPFGSTGPGGLTYLSLRWMQIGIDIEFITPGKPQQNGSHERMHRTLKFEAILPPARDIYEQQYRFDAWRERFNTLRPHESLQQKTPGSVYSPSPRRYTGRKGFTYPGYFEVRSVRKDGMFFWKGTLRFVGEAFGKEQIGLVRDHEDRWLVFAGEMLVGWFHESLSGVRPLSEWESFCGRDGRRPPTGSL
ncbi:integrase core domain-containing protein [Desulfolutivibrio sulfoxidireducens]|uniref:integrase core domain-containing protein n=1 Tax=Desulfolutivibrio sulfoxidireducens TaxID=2773299 RepID=UPI00210AEA69|nr:integrase core domain-containing protein [Desulfolutivibrio sulfoxidireducens]